MEITHKLKNLYTKSFLEFPDKLLQFTNENGPIPEHCPELGPCWIWTRCKSLDKYGYINLGQKQHLVHRVSYEYYNDIFIPEGMFVCHKCDTPACLRPDHLFLGTPLDNTLDSVRKRRIQHGEKSSSAKLTDEQVRNIKIEMKEKNINQYELARQWGVDRSIITMILKGRIWKHIQIIEPTVER